MARWNLILKKLKKLNKYSIGIEKIHNPGHRHGYESFNKKKQINSVNIYR